MEKGAKRLRPLYTHTVEPADDSSNKRAYRRDNIKANVAAQLARRGGKPAVVADATGAAAAAGKRGCVWVCVSRRHLPSVPLHCATF